MNSSRPKLLKLRIGSHENELDAVARAAYIANKKNYRLIPHPKKSKDLIKYFIERRSNASWHN